MGRRRLASYMRRRSDSFGSAARKQLPALSRPAHLCLLPSNAERSMCERHRPKGLTALASRSHSDAETEAFLAQLPIKERRSAGSSLKFCAVAEGDAESIPASVRRWSGIPLRAMRFLRAAGGIVLDGESHPLRYGKAGLQFKNGPFVAWGDRKAILP